MGIKKFGLQKFHKMKLFEHKRLKESEKLIGGLADGQSLLSIAEIHGVGLDDLTKEAEMGITVEMEHTDDKQKAFEIVRDHLVEDPKYYTKLSDADL